MSSRELILSKQGGFREVAYFDEMRPNDMMIKTFEDCEPLVEAAKVLSEMSPRRGETFRHVGLVPLSVLDRSHREGWFNDKSAWRKWRNDPSNSRLRTWPGDI